MGTAFPLFPCRRPDRLPGTDHFAHADSGHNWQKSGAGQGKKPGKITPENTGDVAEPVEVSLIARRRHNPTISLPSARPAARAQAADLQNRPSRPLGSHAQISSVLEFNPERSDAPLDAVNRSTDKSIQNQRIVLSCSATGDFIEARNHFQVEHHAGAVGGAEAHSRSDD